MEELDITPGKHILILNDSFGALSCWFALNHQVTLMSDSHVAHQATQQNLADNQSNNITLCSTLANIPAHVDYVLMQIPRNNRHLTWQLNQLSHLGSCPVIAVNKAKNPFFNTQIVKKYLEALIPLSLGKSTA